MQTACTLIRTDMARYCTEIITIADDVWLFEHREREPGSDVVGDDRAEALPLRQGIDHRNQSVEE